MKRSRSPLEDKIILLITAGVIIFFVAIALGTLFALWVRFIWQPLVGG